MLSFTFNNSLFRSTTSFFVVAVVVVIVLSRFFQPCQNKRILKLREDEKEKKMRNTGVGTNDNVVVGGFGENEYQYKR